MPNNVNIAFYLSVVLSIIIKFHKHISLCYISAGTVRREQGEANNGSSHSTLSNGRYTDVL